MLGRWHSAAPRKPSPASVEVIEVLVLAAIISGTLSSRAPQGYPGKPGVTLPAARRVAGLEWEAVQSPQQLHEPSTPQEMDTAPAFPQQVSPQQLRRRGLGILYRPSKAAEAAKRGGRCYSHLLTRRVVGTAQLMAAWDHFFPLRRFPCKTKHGAGCTTDLENACGERAAGAGFGQQPLKRGSNFHQHLAASAHFTCVLPWVFRVAT